MSMLTRSLRLLTVANGARADAAGFFLAPLVLLALSGCQILPHRVSPSPTALPEATLMDASLFADYPCEAPCWYGLQLGKSTGNDVLATLHSLAFISADSVRETTTTYWDPARQENVEAKLIQAECARPVGKRCVGLVVAGDNLKMVVLFLAGSTTFRDVVEHLGVPEFVQFLRFFGPRCEIRLIWIHKQVIVEHVDLSSPTLCEEGRQGAKIDPNLLVHSATFILPDDIQLTSLSKSKGDLAWPGFVEP